MIASIILFKFALPMAKLALCHAPYAPAVHGTQVCIDGGVLNTPVISGTTWHGITVRWPL